MILSLEYLHNKSVLFYKKRIFQKIIYRDIKPENIMVDDIVTIIINSLYKSKGLS